MKRRSHAAVVIGAMVKQVCVCVGVSFQIWSSGEEACAKYGPSFLQKKEMIDDIAPDRRDSNAQESTRR